MLLLREIVHKKITGHTQLRRLLNSHCKHFVLQRGVVGPWSKLAQNIDAFVAEDMNLINPLLTACYALVLMIADGITSQERLVLPPCLVSWEKA